MKTKYFIMILVVFGFFVLLMPLDAMAGRGCASFEEEDPEDYIAVDKTAPGTKFNGTLTIYYPPSVSCAETNMTDMYFFLRMERNLLQGFKDAGGAEIFSFAGIAECVPYWKEEEEEEDGLTGNEVAEMQQEVINEFFRLKVNPWIYEWSHLEDPDGCDPNSSDPLEMCPPFALKNISSFVEDGDPEVCSGLLFTIVDILIAIDD